ncbi:hypothetical protein C0989_002228 [Termitomyces sp. Mn162]|nr:hypothetical protein C0989_002228 [Termitomyces sp. Mn162]KAH0590641.1 hypothetical protein H2248_000771 [Termitomyces sp. 'cryptogamus']
MLSQLPILLLSLAASVAALSVPQIHGRGGAVNRAVEASTFLPADNTTGVPTAIEAEPTTAGAPITTKVLDNLPSFLTGTQIGQGTFYATGLGACGIVNNDSQHIAAVSHLLFDAFPGYDGINPNTNPVCGRQVTASYQGRSVVVTITDRCEACALTDLDFSPSAFEELAPLSVGRISGMTWIWN